MSLDFLLAATGIVITIPCIPNTFFVFLFVFPLVHWGSFRDTLLTINYRRGLKNDEKLKDCDSLREWFTNGKQHVSLVSVRTKIFPQDTYYTKHNKHMQ